MPWYYYVAHFFVGVFAANGVPHFVQGICGNKFQSPFASPPGVGESSAIVNVVWGWFNFVIAAALVLTTFPPLPPPIASCVAGAFGALGSALWLAHHFGKVRSSAPRP
jgi:hypothetical protein